MEKISYNRINVTTDSSKEDSSLCNKEMVFENKSWVDETDLFEMVLKDWIKKQIDNLSIDLKSKESFINILGSIIEYGYSNTPDEEDDSDEFLNYLDTCLNNDESNSVQSSPINSSNQ